MRSRSSTYWMAAWPLVFRRADMTGGIIFPVVLLETAPQASGLIIWPPLLSVEEVRGSPCDELKAKLDLPLIKLVQPVRLKVWPLRTLSWPITSAVRVGVRYNLPSFTYALESESVVISNCPFLGHMMSRRSR